MAVGETRGSGLSLYTHCLAGGLSELTGMLSLRPVSIRETLEIWFTQRYSSSVFMAIVCPSSAPATLQSHYVITCTPIHPSVLSLPRAIELPLA